MKYCFLIIVLLSFTFAQNNDLLKLNECKRICSILHLPEDSLPDIRIIYARNFSELYSLSDGRIPEWGVGVAIPEQNTIIILKGADPVKAQRVFNHELTHIVLHKKLNEIVIPRWFDEGVAQHLSTGLDISAQAKLAWAVLWRKTYSLRALEQVNTFNSPNAELAYAEAHDAIIYLTEYCKIGDLCDSIVIVEAFAEGFQKGCGMTVFEFYRKWVKHLGRKYLPFVILGDQRFLWTFAVVFFVIFGMLKFIRHRTYMAKLRKEADKYGWEEPPER